MNDIIVQALGLGISASLCFLGYANLKWVRRIGILSYVLAALQAVFLNQPAVLVMNAINLAYYLAVTYEEKVSVIALVRVRKLVRLLWRLVPLVLFSMVCSRILLCHLQRSRFWVALLGW